MLPALQAAGCRLDTALCSSANIGSGFQTVALMLLGCSTFVWAPHADGERKAHLTAGPGGGGSGPQRLARTGWVRGTCGAQLCACVRFGMRVFALACRAGASSSMHGPPACNPASPHCKPPPKHGVCCRLGLGQVRQRCLQRRCVGCVGVEQRLRVVLTAAAVPAAAAQATP